jgi:hypothetical protein
MTTASLAKHISFRTARVIVDQFEDGKLWSRLMFNHVGHECKVKLEPPLCSHLLVITDRRLSSYAQQRVSQATANELDIDIRASAELKGSWTRSDLG